MISLRRVEEAIAKSRALEDALGLGDGKHDAFTAAALCERLDALVAVQKRIAESLERMEPETRPQTLAGKEGPL